MRHFFPVLYKLRCNLILLLAVFSTLITSCTSAPDVNSFSVTGAIKKSKDYSLTDLKAMPSMFLRDVYLINEKKECNDEEKLGSLAGYTGVLLRDVLLDAGMEYKRKWEPGVFIRVKGDNGEAVFSFGEIFYSSAGRSIIVAYEKKGTPMEFQSGCGQLIIHTDLRSGRCINNIREIEVQRVSVDLKAYEDKKKGLQRPSSTEFTIIDHKSGKNRKFTIGDLKKLPKTYIPHALMAGDCEGFGGIFSFKGTPLRNLLEDFGIKGCRIDYNRYVLISSEDGFCSTFSLGEIFNSRLSSNIVIAMEKNEQPLDSKDGFAMSVVREDSMGGRSVKRINSIEIF